MPALYAHNKFGKLVIPKLPSTIKETVRKYPNEFRMGLQGPDFLFFYLKKFIIFLSLFFFIGLILPYHKNYPIFSTLHVFIPLSCIIIALLFLAYLIKNKQKSEPILAHKIYLWFSYGLSIIAMFIIFFSQINGLIEISVLLFINFILYVLQRS